MADATPEKESKRPADTKFKQQKLNAWKPILTPRTVLPTFLAIGVVFIAVGAALLAASRSVHEVEYDYTDCEQIEATDKGQKCKDLLEDTSKNYTNVDDIGKRCRCRFNITVSGFGSDSVKLYYVLDNFYQNHRRYVKSRWDPQLRSTEDSGSGENCDPLNDNGDGKYIAPCGLIANSLFNDTVKMKKCTDATCVTTTSVTLSGHHISWPSDRDVKFQNPSFSGSDLCSAPAFSPTVSAKPPNWAVRACKLGSSIADNGGVYFPISSDFDSSGRGYENEDLIVWMRTAALPSFRKLWRKVIGNVDDGTYQFDIDYNYPTGNFDGSKKILLSTTSWLGGENDFLGICYLVVGSLSLLLVVGFLAFMHFGSTSRRLGDVSYLQWDRE